MTENTTPAMPSEPTPPRKRHRVRTMLLTAAAALAVIIAAAVIAGALSGPHVTKAAAPPTASAPAASFTPAAASPPSSPSTPDLSGPLGTSYDVTTTDASGNDVSYTVTAVTVLDPATGADQYTTPDAGKRFVGVRFTITGTGGYAHDDANNDAVVMGSDGQAYTPDFSSISAGTNFNSGDFSVTGGHTETGWVTFQVPDGVKVASVQWQPGLGGQQPATWTVSAS